MKPNTLAAVAVAAVLAGTGIYLFAGEDAPPPPPPPAAAPAAPPAPAGRTVMTRQTLERICHYRTTTKEGTNRRFKRACMRRHRGTIGKPMNALQQRQYQAVMAGKLKPPPPGRAPAPAPAREKTP